ncbi:MAG: Wzz/FepE/Etk N-terminal domain-containing protein, partial [Candidatus Neomarinimicrobiota bacterium]
MLDILLIIGRYRKQIILITTSFVILGLVTAVFSPNQYTSTAKIIRETVTEGSGGLSGGLATLRGLGINLGGSPGGLTADTYPDILLSQEVLLSVARTTFYFANRDTSMPLAEYYTKYPGLWRVITDGMKKATIGLPGTILGWFREPLPRAVIIGGEVVYASEDESKTIQRLKEQIGIRVDRTSGIIQVAFTSENPLLSARITDTLINHLTERVRTIYSLKARENLEFIRARFEEVKGELEEAEEDLARFTDSNINPTTAHLKTQLARFERLVSFKSQLYSDLQTQFTQAQIELQRSQPVIT